MTIMNSKLQKKYNKTFLNQKNIAYPAEYVIRIFKGNYPKLKLSIDLRFTAYLKLKKFFN